MQVQYARIKGFWDERLLNGMNAQKLGTNFRFWSASLSSSRKSALRPRPATRRPAKKMPLA
jgi:hypothetical protein